MSLGRLRAGRELGQFLGDLDGVPGGALQQLVAGHEQRQAIRVGEVAADAADMDVEVARRFQRHREVVGGAIVDHLHARRLLEDRPRLGGEAAADEFTVLSAALGEALAQLPRKDIIATLEYRERALFLKVKPNTVDTGAVAQLRAALLARKLELVESSAGSWQIRVLSAASGGKQ